MVVRVDGGGYGERDCCGRLCVVLRDCCGEVGVFEYGGCWVVRGECVSRWLGGGFLGRLGWW